VTKILFIYGTRPEAIKMAPLIHEFQKHSEKFKVVICLTGQHREMLDQVNAFFGIKADYDLSLMKPNQNLSDLTARCLSGLAPILQNEQPAIVFVQGDTTSVLSGALAAFYEKIPVAHLEAGLRSNQKYSPFPEEMNRKIAGQIAEYHFAPTKGAVGNLCADGITKNVYEVGNTVIDALLLGLALLDKGNHIANAGSFGFVDFSKRLILVTGHRRESFGDGFENICEAIRDIAQRYSDTEIVYPVHMNPNVQIPVKRILSGLHNVHLIEPLGYPDLLWLMRQCHLVLTDSGGIQEEAPALGKPVLVMRDVTERMEGVEAGTARLVGTSRESIYNNCVELLDFPESYERMSKAVNPYGDGKTSQRIVEIIGNAHR